MTGTKQLGTLSQLIIDRLASGRSLPRIHATSTEGWVGFGVANIRQVASYDGELSPTQFGYRTIVWLGRASIAVRRKD